MINERERTLKEASRKDNGLYTLNGQMLDLSIFVTDGAGKPFEMDELIKPVTITFPIPTGVNSRLAGVYEVQKDGSLAYLGGTLVNDNTAIEIGLTVSANTLYFHWRKTTVMSRANTGHT